MNNYQWTQEDRTEFTDAQAEAQAEIENAEVDKAHDAACKMADQMYAALHPELDDKNHAAIIKTEMIDWMMNGDTALLNTVTVADMVAEWNDYNDFITALKDEQ